MFNPDLIIPLTEAEVYTNARRKINPMTGEVMEDVVSNRPIFRAVEAVERMPEKHPGRVANEGDFSARDRARARARRRVFDLAACNQFTAFITLTLDQEKIDRYDYRIVTKKLGVWLDNLVRRSGFAYLMVPELHKDGALHFHGLCKADGLKLIPAGRKDKKGRDIYNIANWRYGFTTAVLLDGDYSHVCKYITKYITKSNTEMIGGRYYYHGGNLREPLYQYYNANWWEADGKLVEIEEAGLKLVYK